VRMPDGSVVLVTPPDCLCGDMFWRNYYVPGGEPKFCKHLKRFYADPRRTSLALSLDARTVTVDSDSVRDLTYDLTLLYCQEHGLCLLPGGGLKLCEHAEAAFKWLTGWHGNIAPAEPEVAVA